MNDDDRTVVCPACGRVLPAERGERHLAGLDPKHMDCPRQDLEAIKAEAEQQNTNISSVSF
ncbi:MAG TPA: hypothetical protein VFT50_14160 [Baekduia sp.]|nr:hypothetical protein [Baekduia sp.]